MPIQCKPMHCEGDLSSFKWKTHHKINTSLLMLREWTYTASSRDALGNTSPSALEISLGRGFCTPRPSRFPSGFALGKPLGPRGAKSTPLGNLSGLGGCISQYIPPLGSVRIQYIPPLGSVRIQYLQSFAGVQTCSSSSIHLQGWYMKSIPAGREGVTLLKSILPRCRSVNDHCLMCMGSSLRRVYSRSWGGCSSTLCI